MEKLTERHVNRTPVFPPRDHARAVISSYSVIKKLRGQEHLSETEKRTLLGDVSFASVI